MKPRSRRVVAALVSTATVVSLVFCFAMMGLAIFRDQLHSKYCRVGPIEALSHHDLVIISWRPVVLDTQPKHEWSFDTEWIGFDIDTLRGKTVARIYTVNFTQAAAIVALAILPGIWIAGYIRRRWNFEVQECSACGCSLDAEAAGVCPKCGTAAAELVGGR